LLQSYGNDHFGNPDAMVLRCGLLNSHHQPILFNSRQHAACMTFDQIASALTVAAGAGAVFGWVACVLRSAYRRGKSL
jgi:hypothetical protein